MKWARTTMARGRRSSRNCVKSLDTSTANPPNRRPTESSGSPASIALVVLVGGGGGGGDGRVGDTTIHGSSRAAPFDAARVLEQPVKRAVVAADGGLGVEHDGRVLQERHDLGVTVTGVDELRGRLEDGAGPLAHAQPLDGRLPGVHGQGLDEGEGVGEDLEAREAQGVGVARREVDDLARLLAQHQALVRLLQQDQLVALGRRGAQRVHMCSAECAMMPYSSTSQPSRSAMLGTSIWKSCVSSGVCGTLNGWPMVRLLCSSRSSHRRRSRDSGRSPSCDSGSKLPLPLPLCSDVGECCWLLLPPPWLCGVWPSATAVPEEGLRDDALAFGRELEDLASGLSEEAAAAAALWCALARVFAREEVEGPLGDAICAG
ncbi:hypothetical protein PG995_007874 [Apiospora arundinis]